MDFNPGSTATKGVQWIPRTATSVTLDALTKIAAMSMVQTTAQTIGTARVYVGAIPTREGYYGVEVYDAETAVAANVATVTAVPNEDVSGVDATTGWCEDDAGTTNIYDQIDETTLDTTDYIRANASGASYVGRFGTVALTLTSKRILAVRLKVTAEARSGGDLQTYLQVNGTSYPGPSWSTNEAAGSPTTKSTTFLTNPSARAPWTIATVQAFDGANYGFVLTAANGVGDQARVYQVLLEVVTCDENRIAFGVLDDVGSALTANAWNAVTLLTPTGGAWTKDGSGRHLYTVRRLGTVGSLVVPMLEAAAVPPSASGYAPTLDPTYLYATAMGSAVAKVFGVIQRTTAPAESVDSQPYVLQVDATVYTGQDAEQEFSDAAVADYGQYRFAVKYTGTPTGDLLVKLKRRSDNTQFGTTVTVTKAQVDAETAVGGYVLLTVSAATFGTLATATQYYIEFSSATDASNPWDVLALDTANQGNGATFGGTTDRAVVDGSEADRYDLAVTVSSVPTAPASLTVTESVQTLAGATDTPCDVESLQYLALDWSSTSLGVDFDYYEVQRSEDGGSTWNTIATIADAESNSDYPDYEAALLDTAFYRVRVIRASDSAASSWSNVDGGTIAPGKCELRLVSNVDPSLNVAYNWSQHRRYHFPDADAIVDHDVYQRDGAVSFMPTEDRLVEFATALTVNVGPAPQPGRRGVAVFTDLREITRAQGQTIPYIAVLDHLGNRWYARVRFADGDEQQRPGELCVAEIHVKELTRTPFVHEVT